MILFILDQFDDKNLFLIFANGLSGVQFDQLHAFCKGFKEKRWRANPQERGWSIPLNSETLRHLDNFYIEGKDYKVTPNAALMLAYKKILTKVDVGNAESRWDYLFNGKEPTYNYPSWDNDPDEHAKPLAHQRVAHQALMQSPYFALLMEMGTGKTKCIVDELDSMARELKDGEVIRALICCPKSLRYNWAKEIRRFFSPFHHMELRLLDGQLGSLQSVLELLQSAARIKIAIVSTDSVRGNQEALVCYHPTYLCIDESHYLKNPESKRFKSIKQYTEIAEKRRILTGTPVVNQIVDLWSQFEVLEPGVLGYNTFTGFKRQFCNIVQITGAGGEEFEKITGNKNVEELKEAMSRCSFIVRKERCLDLPERSYETRTVEMPANLRAMYDELENNFRLALDSHTKIETDFVIVQMLKLAQMCCGFVVADHAGKVEIVDETPIFSDITRQLRTIDGGDAKMLAMLDDAEEICAEGKLIIWCRFHYDIDTIVSRLNGRGIKTVGFDGRTPEKLRNDYVSRFNSDPALRCFVAQPNAGGVGLTLLGNQDSKHDRCKVAFFYSNGYSFGQRDQAEARNHRLGQRDPVCYRDYVYENTIEQAIAKALQTKKDVAEIMKDVSTLRDKLLVREKT